MRTAVVEAMNPNGKIINCGKIAQYDAAGGEAGGDEARERAIQKQNNIAAYDTSVNKWEDEFLECSKEIVELYKQGKLVDKSTVVVGLENLGKAFAGIYAGDNIGRMLVKVA